MKKSRFTYKKTFAAGLMLSIPLVGILNSFSLPINAQEINFLSPVASEKSQVGEEVKISSPSEIALEEVEISELEQIVAYIARTFEPEGTKVVVRAINCFYSESGLRANAVGQNSDEHRSKDHGVAQLNDYWHNLSQAEKTEIKANIDRAYQIYKGRGGNFSAWHGKLCN